MRITVAFSDAVTDVLVYLVDHGPASVKEIARAVAPEGHPMPGTVTAGAVGTLLRCGLVAGSGGVWSATDEGRRAVSEARDRPVTDEEEQG